MFTIFSYCLFSDQKAFTNSLTIDHLLSTWDTTTSRRAIRTRMFIRNCGSIAANHNQASGSRSIDAP